MKLAIRKALVVGLFSLSVLGETLVADAQHHHHAYVKVRNETDHSVCLSVNGSECGHVGPFRTQEFEVEDGDVVLLAEDDETHSQWGPRRIHLHDGQHYTWRLTH